MPETDPQLLTVVDAAYRLKVSTKTVYRALMDGTLTGSKLGSVWRIRACDLEAWIDGGRERVRPASHRPAEVSPLPPARVGSPESLRRIAAGLR